MAAFRGMLWDSNTTRVRDITFSELNAMVDRIGTLLDSDPVVELTVVSSNGNISPAMVDTRYMSGTYASTTGDQDAVNDGLSEYPSEAQTGEPVLVTAATYDRVSQVFNVPDDFFESDYDALEAKPIRVISGGAGFQEMNYNDVLESFVEPLMDAYESALGTGAAGGYFISTNASEPSATLQSATPVYTDTRVNLAAYSTSLIGGSTTIVTTNTFSGVSGSDTTANAALSAVGGGIDITVDSTTSIIENKIYEETVTNSSPSNLISQNIDANIDLNSYYLYEIQSGSNQISAKFTNSSGTIYQGSLTTGTFNYDQAAGLLQATNTVKDGSLTITASDLTSGAATLGVFEANLIYDHTFDSDTVSSHSQTITLDSDNEYYYFYSGEGRGSFKIYDSQLEYVESVRARDWISREHTSWISDTQWNGYGFVTEFDSNFDPAQDTIGWGRKLSTLNTLAATKPGTYTIIPEYDGKWTITTSVWDSDAQARFDAFYGPNPPAVAGISPFLSKIETSYLTFTGDMHLRLFEKKISTTPETRFSAVAQNNTGYTIQSPVGTSRNNGSTWNLTTNALSNSWYLQGGQYTISSGTSSYQDHFTSVNYYLHKINSTGTGTQGSGYGTPMTLDRDSNGVVIGLRHMTYPEFDNMFGKMVKYASYAIPGYRFRYNFDANGENVGSAIQNNQMINVTGSMNYRFVNVNDYRAQEWPNGTNSVVDSWQLKLERT